MEARINKAKQEAIELMKRYNAVINSDTKSFEYYDAKELFESVDMVAHGINLNEFTMELVNDFLPTAYEVLAQAEASN